MENANLLEIENLKVSFFMAGGEIKAVRGISYAVKPGEIMGIVGESGSGKSAQAYSIMGLLKRPGRVTGGSIKFRGAELLGLTRREYEELRGSKISMIFQNPMTCVNPVIKIGEQLIETVRCHSKVSKAYAHHKAVSMLKLVGIADAERRMAQYSHELSGGMLQRVMIAMALICDPVLLIADEPTTSLDVTIQAQILELIKSLQKKTGMSVIFITHNLGIVADICDAVSVMYAGKIVEQGTVDDIFYASAHPYTRGLLKSLPSLSEEDSARLTPIEGMPVDISELPTGCAFHPRCPARMDICAEAIPPEVDLGERHYAACWLHKRQGG